MGKSRNENPGSLDFMSELAKGRFSVTANVNKEGSVYSAKLFDKANSEGADAAMREFKNLKTLKHEKMVSLVDAFETDRFSLLQFNALPSTDVLTYIAEKSFYTENTVCEIAGQVLDALEYIHWRGKVYLNLEPANILVCSGRSLGRTVQVKLANFETTQTVSTSGTQIKGTYNFDYAAPEILEEAKAFPQSDVWSLGVLLYVLMSGQLPFKGETPEETKDNILRVQFKFEWLYKECTMLGPALRRLTPTDGPILPTTCSRRESVQGSPPTESRSSPRTTTSPSPAWTWTASLSWPDCCSKFR